MSESIRKVPVGRVRPTGRSRSASRCVMALFAAIVIVGSLQVGIGWGAEGPRAGFFPFYISLIILISSAINLVRRRAAKARGALFADWGQLRQVLAVVVPTAIYVSRSSRASASTCRPALLIGVFMRWLGRYRWVTVLAIAIGVPLVTYRHVRDVVPRPAAEGAARRLARLLRASRLRAPVRHGIAKARHDGRNRQSVSRLRRRAAAVQHRADGRRHRARRHHRRAARPRRRQRRRDPAAADLLHVADLGDHHAVLHLLGRAVRRRHHLGPVQHSGRTMVGGDHLRRPSDGAAGQGRRGADRGLHLVVRRRAVRGHHDHAGGAAGRELRAASSGRRKNSRSISSPSAASSA